MAEVPIRDEIAILERWKRVWKQRWLNGEPITGDFMISSLGKIDTLQTDRDVGVVRVPGKFLNMHARRNALLRIVLLGDRDSRRKSIVRIARAATGPDNKSLRGNQIALQYDDRAELGITDDSKAHSLEIIRVGYLDYWRCIPLFLFGHTSPVVRLRALFSVGMALLGAILGFLTGLKF